MDGWQDIRSGPLDPAHALALADALLDQQSGGAQVLWTRPPDPALILGRGAQQPVVDWQACARRGLTVYRRRSGGGAVLWDDALFSFDVILSAGHPLLDDDIVASYRWLGEALGEALQALGLATEIVDRECAHRDVTPEEVEPVCFGGLSPWEVRAEGRKVVGLSQARRRSGAIFPVGIPLWLDADLMAELLGGGSPMAATLRGRAAGLGELDPDIDRAALEAAVRAALSERLGAPRPQEVSGAATAVARQRVENYPLLRG